MPASENGGRSELKAGVTLRISLAIGLSLDVDEEVAEAMPAIKRSIDPRTHIGHVHLKLADLKRLLLPRCTRGYCQASD